MLEIQVWDLFFVFMFGIRSGICFGGSCFEFGFVSRVWDSFLGFSFGIQVRGSGFGFRFWIQVWNTGLEFNSDIQVWDSGLGFTFAIRVWDSGFIIRFGFQKIQVRVSGFQDSGLGFVFEGLGLKFGLGFIYVQVERFGIRFGICF